MTDFQGIDVIVDEFIWSHGSLLPFASKLNDLGKKWSKLIAVIERQPSSSTEPILTPDDLVDLLLDVSALLLEIGERVSVSEPEEREKRELLSILKILFMAGLNRQRRNVEDTSSL